MSMSNCKYTDLKIRLVEEEVETWEGDGVWTRSYFELVDEAGNVYATFDSL